VQLWQWVERAAGRPALHREHCHRPGDSGEVLLRRLTALDPPPAAPLGTPAVVAERDAVESAVLIALLRRVRRRHPAAFRSGGEAERVLARDEPLSVRALALIEEYDDPALLRALWHALTTLAVLDPACGRGERLLAALELLEPLYDALLERTRGWLADAERTRVARRPERSAALRAASARFDGDGDPATRRAAIRSAIARDNLFGADPRASAAPAALPHLRTGDVRLGYRRSAEIGEDRLREDIELLGRAAALASSGEPGAAFAERQATLRAALDRHLAREHGVDLADADALATWLAERQPLHACVEWPAVARRGGFDVVFDARGRSAVRERRAGFGAMRSDAPERLCFVPCSAAAYPKRLAAALGEWAPALLTLRGDPALLDAPLVALLASVEVSAAVALATFELVRALREAGVAVVSGFQSPLERACLDVLLGGTAPVVVCAARGIDDLRLPASWRAPLAAGRLLVASGFAPRLRRPTRELAAERNRHVAALSQRVLVAHAAPGGKTYRLAAERLRAGARVHTIDDPANADLLLLGALPIDAARAAALCAGLAPERA
jgi:hypothetical protein